MSKNRAQSIINPLIGLIVLLLVCNPFAYTQLRSATVAGTVTDESKAVVPDATITLVDEGTQFSNNATTNASGNFAFPYLAAGKYTVTVNASGFASYRQTGITLGATQTLRLEIALTLASVQSVVEVQASAETLQTDNPSMQTAVNDRIIEAIPNVTQNPLYYSMLQAGVQPTVNSQNSSNTNAFAIGVDGRRQFSAIGVNGGRPFTNEIQVDGLPVMGGGYNETSVIPNTEGLSEVRVISNNFTAEYGRGQSAISMNTKSGTNEFHGQAAYTLRNEALNANSFENNARGIARTAFKVNEWGGAVTGPVIKNKLFFSSSYHYLQHNRGTLNLATVPTELERVGNFSQTRVFDQNGVPIPVQINNPYSVTQIGPQLYERAPFPNAIIPNPNPYALKMLSYYPLPNRTPDDARGVNNFQSNTVQTIRRHNLSNRVDYMVGNHSIYGSGGLEYGKILTPRAFGESPVNGAPSTVKDNNPYAQIGDVVVLSPTLVLDVRYGYNRIATENLGGDKSGFTDYDGFGVPKNVQSLIQIYGAAPFMSPGSPWTSLTGGFFQTKVERQQGHTLNTSVTKTAGKWTMKFGTQYRVLLSNYMDLEEASVAMPGIGFAKGGNFTFRYVTPDGESSSLNNNPTLSGYNPAAFLTGAGVWWVRPGANVAPAYAQKYWAIYTQNDWRATRKLTVNLGLRWDLQPGPTERYNRMASYDLTAKNAWGGNGAIVFPGTNGYSRNLWDTQYNNIQPRLGAAYQVNDGFVLRGGFGITYLPSNTGYFSGPTNYGSNTFSSGVNMLPYPNNNAIPEHFSDAPPLQVATGANSAAPQLYGQGGNQRLFDRDFQNGKAYQWNVFAEKQLPRNWFVSLGYSASAGRDLMLNNFQFQNLQLIDPSVLDSWRNTYIASSGTLNPANELVPNPLQPTNGPLIPFGGVQGQSKVQRQLTYYPYLLLANGTKSFTNGFSDYHSMVASARHSFSNGFLVDMHYTWSKALDYTLTDIADGQGFNPAGGVVQSPDFNNINNRRKYSHSDIPHRFVATILYETPELSSNTLVRNLTGNWSLGSVLIRQSGFPIPVSGASDGSVLGLPDRTDGVPIMVPEEMRGWYDGKTSVTLPCGRTITPQNHSYLLYSTCAFSGRTVTGANGNTIVDQFWYGNSAQNYGDMRTLPWFNLDLSLRRQFRVREGFSIEFAANATNLLNHTELVGAATGGLGSTNVRTDAASGLKPGMGSSANFGGYGRATYSPRQVTMNVRIRF